MSTMLPSLNLAGATVGTTGSIDFNQFVKISIPDPLHPAHIGLFNESGCGCQLTFVASGNSQYLPAGGWGSFPLTQTDGKINVVVLSVLANPQISSLSAVYYAPGEAVPSSLTLGNSPTAIGGTISVSTVQQLINDGNVAGTQIVEATVSGDTASAVSLTNDGKYKLGDVAHPGVFTVGGSAPGVTDPSMTNDGFGDLAISTAFGLTMQILAGGDTQFFNGIDPVLTGVTVAGTSGSATLYQIMQGTSGKIFFLVLSGYASGATNTLTFPTAFTKTCQFWTGTIAGTGSYSFIHSSSPVTCDVLITLSSTGGTTSAITTIKQMTQGQTRGGFESIQLAPFGSPTSASIWGIGI